MTHKDLVSTLLEAEGFDDEYDFLETFALDSIVPGICHACESVQDGEPDARANYCDNCGKNKVESGLSLLGII